MARQNQEAIETFMSITGASKEIAEQKLEEHGGDLNAAVNSHFSEGDRGATANARATSIVAAQDDVMDIDDDPVEVRPWGPPPLSHLAATELSNPLSLLDPNFRSGLFDPTTDLTNSEPFVTHPREVRRVPIEFKNDDRPSGPSGVGPVIEDVTETVHTHVSDTRGAVIIDDDDDDDDDDALASWDSQTRRRTTGSSHDAFVNQYGGPPRALARRPEDMQDNDIEEQMIRAAIEASKREVIESLPNKQFGVDNNNVVINQGLGRAPLEDPDLAHAVSLSLKAAAEQEKATRKQEQGVGDSSEGASKSAVVELGNTGPTNGRLELGGSSSVPDEVEDVDDVPLVRHRSRRMSFGSMESAKDVEVIEDSPPLSPRRPITGPPTSERNGDPFHSEDWGGLSSLEHDEAVMLEAAMFGGIPEETRYRFPYAPHQMMRPEGRYPRPTPRPPSPNLTAQRLIREQQDDEYLASLQADREKELKAIEEAEARLEEERKKEEESLKKLEEEKELERLLTAKEAALPQEPASNDEKAVNLMVRMPDGSRRGRRFLKSDNLQSLFDFIDIGRAVQPGSYRLVRPYPRRAFEEGESNLTLSELGLSSKQEALYLELI